MSRINPFQQYSQTENTITNNVLLLLSNLYELESTYYEELISALTEVNEYSASPSFQQQVSTGNSGIIDGEIHIKASRIIIETKINALEIINKLLKYTDKFKPHEQKILIHLSASRYSQPDIKDINDRLLENEKLEDVIFLSLTYQDLVDQLESLSKNYFYDRLLLKLFQDFQDYCTNMNLMPQSKYVLRAMACGGSFELNIKHQFYFDLSNRGYRHFNYLGIYKEKAVRYIGSVENVIVADYIDEKLIIHDFRHPVSDKQKDRLIIAIKDSIEHGWDDVNKSHRFFLLKDFNKTYFYKKSKGGIYRVRYFDLEEYLSNDLLGDVSTISQGLENRSWKQKL